MSFETESLCDAAAADAALAQEGDGIALLPLGTGAETASHYERCSIPIATAGQAVARAMDRAKVELGPNVQWADDGCTIVATVGGQVRLCGRRIWVEQVLEIPGDVDFSSGHIHFERDVIIRGGVQDLFKVCAGGTVRIARDIEAAEVQAGLDLLVGGGISGKEKGRCQAGRDVRAKYIRNAVVEAGRDVIVDKEISQSRVICSGKAQIEDGAILAGHVTATGGITCQAAGSSSGVLTVLEAGIDEPLRRLVAEQAPKIEAEIAQIAKVRATIEPLLRNRKTLSAEQKEEATELLFNAGELEERNRQTIQMLQRRREETAARSVAEILVKQVIFAGVTIRLAGLETTVATPIRGPVRITLRKSGNVQRIVAGSPHDATTGFGLETRAVADQAMQALDRILAKSRESSG